MSRFRDRLARLSERRRAAMSDMVTYARGEDSVELLATVGATRVEDNNQDGFTVRVIMKDYIITAADLILGEELTLPTIGDTIAETVGDKVYTYEVQELGQERCYRTCDPDGRTLRVHVKELSVEDAD